MGFEVSRAFTLDFSDTDWEGAIVKVRAAPIAVILEMGECDLTREAELLAEYVAEWNLEHYGKPIEISQEAIFNTLEPAGKNLIIKEWMRASRGITAPLDRRSDAGESSPEVENVELSIPMETQSPSLETQ